MCDSLCTTAPYPRRMVPAHALPMGADRTGCVQTTPGAMRQLQAYGPQTSYYNFFRAQTLPYQVEFSGYGQTCNGCQANRFAVWIPSEQPTDALLPARRPSLTCGRPLAPSTASLMPLGSCGSFAGPSPQGYKARVPYLGLPGAQMSGCGRC